MDLTRKQVIDNLSYIADSMPDDACAEWRDSLAYAISSLKTDETYQLMYEGVEVYDKDTVAGMFRELQLEIEKKSYYDTTIIGNYEDEVRISLVELDDVNDIIQNKINKLRGEEK